VVKGMSEKRQLTLGTLVFPHHSVGAPKASRNQKIDPLLKWPGGKRALLRNLLALVPGQFGRYFEPFLGGGALFFALRPHEAFLSDLNKELIECYVAVRDYPEQVIQHLRSWPNSRHVYYSVRRSSPRSTTRRAARLIYLSTLAFNGIFRVNRQGKFNVPYGHKTHVDVVQPGKICATSKVLKSALLKHCDFEEAVKPARMGDLLYFDPPYTVAHGTNGFRKYNSRIFSWNDQIRLAAIVHRLADRGCHVIVSNACHDSVRDLYADFKQVSISRVSRVSASSDARRIVHELIIANVI